MGIDIYLNVEQRSRERVRCYDQLGKDRERLGLAAAALARGGDLNALNTVSEICHHMAAGETGYLRSGHNSNGMFPILTEVFGFDVAAYLFPEIWGSSTMEDFWPLDGGELARKVNFLAQTATMALEQQQYTLPWIREFAAITGEPVPYDDLCQEEIEAITGAMARATERVTQSFPEPRERESKMSLPLLNTFVLYLRDLLNFANLAKTLNEAGKATSVSCG